MIKELNILIKFGKVSIAGFKGSLFIMQLPSASARKGKEKERFLSVHSTTIHSFSRHKLPLLNISSLIYDCRSYLTAPCGLIVACMQETNI